MLTCYNVKIITFTRLRIKRHKWKINLNKNQKNKYINSSNLRIQLRNYSGINPKSLALHGLDKIHDNMIKERKIKEKEEREM